MPRAPSRDSQRTASNPAQSSAPTSSLVPLAALAILALTIAVYLPALKAGFIWDDDAYVTHNPVLSEPGGLFQIWLSPRATIQYYPLVFTTFWMEHKLWGFAPTGYHVTNILLHAVAAWLFWWLLRKLDISGAWLAAAIFAVHPVCVESVAWVTERKNVLSMVFYLLAATSYFRFAGLDKEVRPTKKAPDWPAYVAAVLLFACALLSKTATCGLPVALLLVIWWKRGRVRAIDVAPTIPFFLLAGVLAFVTTYVEKTHVGAAELDWTLSISQRFLLAGRSLVFYLFKLVWPANLAFIYHRPAIDPSQLIPWVCPVAVAAVFLLLWLTRKRIGRGPVAAMLYFAVTLAPALGFVLFYFMTYSYVADHFQYHACLGPIALFAAAVSRGTVSTRRFLTGAALMVVVASGVLTFRRCGVFENSETLWNDVLAKSPSAKRMAHDNLAVYYCGIGRLEEGVRNFRESLQVKPNEPDVLSQLGATLYQLGRIDEGVAALREAVRIKPDHPQAHCNIGLLLAGQGKRDEALQHYTEALRLNPEMVEAHFNLARLLVSIGRIPDAIGHYEEVLRLNPSDADARRELELIKTGRVQGSP